MVRRRPIYVPFQLSDLRKILKHLDNYTDAQTNTLKPLSLDPNLSIDMKRYYASTRTDSFLIRKTMGSGPGHSG
jgi:hypothetical protein